MSDGRLLLVPEGGLGNRMRAIASAYEFCRRIGSKLDVVWFDGWGMRAPFYQLFEPANDAVMTLRDASKVDALLYETPRRHNLWVPGMAQRLLFQRRIYAKSMFNRKRDAFDFEEWGRGKKCYMSSYHQFNTFPDELYAKLFVPLAEVRERVGDNARRLSPTAIGMHIRRTDNQESIDKSPLSLFIDKGKEELASHPDLSIFLATDSEEVKGELKAVFGDRVVTSDREASRDSVAGIRDAIVDMWTLASCQRIYGSAGSSFSPMAASIANGKASFECLSV